MKSYDNRKNVPEEYKWDLSNFVKNDEEYQEKIKYIQDHLKEIKKYVGCSHDANKLCEYIEFDIDLGSYLEDLDAYTYLLQAQDLANDDASSKRLYVSNLLTQYAYESSFFTPELLSLSKEEYNDLFKEEKCLKYKNYLDNIYRYKEHSLSEDEEKIVSLLTENLPTYSNIQSSILNSCNDYGTVSLEDGTNVTLTLTNYRKLMKTSNREKRKEIYLQFQSVVRRYAPIIAIALNDYFKEQTSISKIYNFGNSWERKLFKIDLSDKVFEILTNTIEKHADYCVKYEKLRSKVLEIKDLMPWDNSLDIAKNDKEYSIDDARTILMEALKPLGEDYLNHFQHIFDSKSVDYCQYNGKQSGACSVSTFNKHDSKIYMSFNGEFLNVSTLAHEGGHHVNHQYICENNIPLYSTNSSLTGEVASLTNEFLLSYYMAGSKDKNEALVGLANAIDILDSNIFGAVIEGNIERYMYQAIENGESITTSLLDELTEKELLKYSDKDELKHEYQKNSWCLRSHYFMFYYLYSYAICASVASYVAKNIIDGNKEVLDKYLEFLKTGSNVTVTDTYKILGIDLEDKHVYEEAMEFYNSLLELFMKVKES